jgi:hypothetical protein
MEEAADRRGKVLSLLGLLLAGIGIRMPGGMGCREASPYLDPFPTSQKTGHLISASLLTSPSPARR